MNKLAINGGKMYKTVEFPTWPMSGEREMELVEEVVKSRNWWRMTGDKVETFEREFGKLHDAKYCLGVTNGTHALELALATLDIGRGDEVIVPGFTFISTATAVFYCNATPVPVDVCSKTLCLDPDAFEKAITPNTKAVIPVHMAGHSCDMDRICEIAKKHNIKIIEDASHAHGAEWKNKKIGTFGDIGTFSCQNGKLMTAGEGGAILTNSKELYEKAYLIHTGGRPKGDKLYQHVLLGTNYRMSEVQAALLIAQLERLEKLNAIREKNASILDEMLKEVDGITPQGRDENATLNTHYMYMFYYDESKFGGLSRNDFVEALNAEGIPSFVAYPVVSNTEFFAKNQFRSHIQKELNPNCNDMKVANRIEKEVVWLPHQLLLGDKQHLNQIVGGIKKIQECTAK